MKQDKSTLAHISENEMMHVNAIIQACMVVIACGLLSVLLFDVDERFQTAAMYVTIPILFLTGVFMLVRVFMVLRERLK